jgi:hypothetical protein
MNLEMNGAAADWQALKVILKEIGLSSVEAEDEMGLRAVLGNGELTISVSLNQSSRGGVIRAEGKHECTFNVTGGVVLRITNSMYEEAVATIRYFLTRITERTNILFVLSFQLEGVYATRDRQRGFEWFWDTPR